MDSAHDSQSPFDDHEHGSQEYGSVDQPPVVDPVGDIGEHTIQEVHDPRPSHYLDEDPANKAQIQIDPHLSGDTASTGLHASEDSTKNEQPSAEPDERYIVTEQGKLEYIRGLRYADGDDFPDEYKLWANTGLIRSYDRHPELFAGPLYAKDLPFPLHESARLITGDHHYANFFPVVLPRVRSRSWIGDQYNPLWMKIHNLDESVLDSFKSKKKIVELFKKGAIQEGDHFVLQVEHDVAGTMKYGAAHFIVSISSLPTTFSPNLKKS